ncbi:hypothetical protein GCM10010446_21360 [Streptomyces enissocaesilis]|uniref:Uncharacterized protein n=1 Tax=Streptomyces enissocaesilis TaxID=332589 RepID=A0ABP6JL08_9ACTN
MRGGGPRGPLVREHGAVDDVRAGSPAVGPAGPRPRSRPVTPVRRRDRLPSPAERAFTGLLREAGGRPRELADPWACVPARHAAPGLWNSTDQ